MNDSLFQKINTLIRKGAAPGCAVALSDNGKMQLFACGHFSTAASPAVTPRTVYDLASVSKLFTAALILRLQEAGKLSIYDRCGAYLDNFRGSDARLIDLPTHRLDFGLGMSQYRAKYRTATALYNALAHIVPPVHASQGVTYANAGPFFLGLIAEKVAAKPLHDLMQDLCIDLGLPDTYTGPDIARLNIKTPPEEVVGDTVVQGVTHDETARMLGGLAGHAGVFSTAADLAVFGSAWLSGKVVHAETLRHAVFHDYDESGESPQALGWWLRYPAPAGNNGYVKTPGVYSHTGFTGPLLAIRPANGKAAALTCNRTYYGRDNKRHREIWELLIRWVADR